MNNKQLTNLANKRFLVILNSIAESSAYFQHFGVGRNTPITPNVIELWMKLNDSTIRIDPSDSEKYLYLTYDIFLYDGLGDSTSETNLDEVIDTINTYQSYLTMEITKGAITSVSGKYAISSSIFKIDLQDIIDESGCCDILNIEGQQGPQGSNGNGSGSGTASQGPQGPQGAQGTTGAGLQGSQGVQGAAGPQGFTGVSGPMGFQGNTGNTGQVGPIGATGSQGSTGPQGNQGNVGVGVPIGGTGGQVLAKIDSTNYNTTWVDIPSGTKPIYPWTAKIQDHFEADKITGYSDGANLSSWINTGKGTAALADAVAPTYTLNYRGMPAVKFTRASSTSMTFNALAAKQHIIVLNNVDAGNVFADYEAILGNTTAGTDFTIYATVGTTDMNLGSLGTEIQIQGFYTSNNSFDKLTNTKIVSAKFPSGVSARDVRIGAFWSIAGRYWNGYIHEIITFSEVLTKEEYNELHHYLVRKYGMAKPIQLFCDGNSLMSGGFAGVSATQSIGGRMIAQVNDRISALAYTYNASVGGTVTDQNDFYAKLSTGIDYRQDNRTLFGRQIIIIYSSTNQLASAGSGAALMVDLMDYCTNRIAVNPEIEIYIPTALSCTASYIDETERQLFNAQLRSMTSTKNIKIINTTDPQFDGATAYSGSNYLADGIHLNPTGCNTMSLQYLNEIFKY